MIGYVTLGTKEAAERFARVDPQSPYLLDLQVHVAVSAGRNDDAQTLLAELRRRAEIRRRNLAKFPRAEKTANE